MPNELAGDPPRSPLSGLPQAGVSKAPRPGNKATRSGVYSDVENAPDDAHRCGYCRARLDYGTREALRHAIRHLGEDRYLASYHRYLERQGYDELSAHLLTLRSAETLARHSRGHE